MSDRFNVLIVVDAQNDFVTGSLATPGAVEIVPKIAEYVWDFRNPPKIENPTRVIFTRDSHVSNYLDTLEGKHIPVAHCIFETPGWCIVDELSGKPDSIVNKVSFGVDWKTYFNSMGIGTRINSIELAGFCTDICVVSNSLILRQQYPNVPIRVHKDLCAGTSKEAHEAALLVMKQCLIEVV